MLERADVKLLFTVTDFLDTNYEALLRAEPALPQLREIVDLRGPAWRDFLARDAGASPSRHAHRRRSLLDPVHVGNDRPAQGRDVDARRNRARVRRVVDGGRPPRRRPLPRGEPLLPLVRLERGHRCLARQGRHDHPPPGVRRRRGDDARRRGARVDAARTADGLPVDPRSSAPGRVRHVVPAPRGDGRGPRARGDDPAHARRARLRDHRHRIRPHRSHRYRDDVPSRRRSRDDLDHLRARDPRRRGAHRQRRRRQRFRAANRARW